MRYNPKFLDTLLEGATLKGTYAYAALYPNGDIRLPERLVPFDKLNPAKANRHSYVHFYLEDYKFISSLFRADSLLERLLPYGGIIGPDPSIYIDMPDYLASSSVWLNRLVSSYFQRHGFPVIFNVRFGGPETFVFCFDGIPEGSVISIGTLGACKNPRLRACLYEGTEAAIEAIRPKAILFYGKEVPGVKERHPEIEIKTFMSEIEQIHKEER